MKEGQKIRGIGTARERACRQCLESNKQFDLEASPVVQQ